MSEKNFQTPTNTPSYFTNEDRARQWTEPTTKEPIQTHYIYPPIPIRNHDWVAYRDPERRPYGYGRTEAEAIQDLINNEKD